MKNAGEDMMQSKENFIISKENWSLHRKGYQDQQRHKEKIKEAIKNNLSDLISEENIIMSDGKDVVKIPIRSLDEYKIRYDHSKSKHVGQGSGDSKLGDVVARDGSKDGEGKGNKAGDQPGEDYFEAEVSIAEIEEVFFKELELPDLKQKDTKDVMTEDIAFNDIRKKGLMGNIDKKRTILTALKRNATRGKVEIAPIKQDDLRFKTWNDITIPESSAVVLAMMDTSGSMGKFEKYMARSFFFWMTRFLRSKYETVEIVFIAHHTQAKVVSEKDFFSKGESGGTICSSAYEKALELIQQKYSPSNYNLYPFHFSDGDNMYSDNKKCMKLVNEIMEVSNLFGYGEVNKYNRNTTLMRSYKEIDNPKFRHYILQDKADIYHSMKAFFQKESITMT